MQFSKLFHAVVPMTGVKVSVARCGIGTVNQRGGGLRSGQGGPQEIRTSSAGRPAPQGKGRSKSKSPGLAGALRDGPEGGEGLGGLGPSRRQTLQWGSGSGNRTKFGSRAVRAEAKVMRSTFCFLEGITPHRAEGFSSSHFPLSTLASAWAACLSARLLRL